MTTHPKRFDSLTGVRGILALLVVIAHGFSRLGWLENYPATKPWITSFGHFGVAGFFILSGFILKMVYDNRLWTLREFAVNRFARIYPLYLVCLLFTLPIDWMSPGFPAEGRSEALALSLLLQQSWLEFSNGRFNGPGWTLSVEFFFYALFPLLFRLITKHPKHFIALFGALFAATWYLWDPTQFYFAHRVPHMRLWEFMLGILVADQFTRYGSSKIFRQYPNQLAAASILSGLSLGACLSHWNQFPFAEWLAMAVCAAIMITALASADQSLSNNKPLASRYWILAGEISYGVYLIHDGIQRYAKVALARFIGSEVEEMPLFYHFLFVGLSMVASISFALILWHLIEKPSRDFLRRKLSPHSIAS